MKTLVASIFILLLSILTLGQQNYSITSNAAGGVRLGMTVAQARRVLNGCRLKRDSDGDGAVLIGVTCGRRRIMTLFAGEENYESPINKNARVEFIEVWDKRFKTAEGVHKGMLVSMAEQKIGKVKEIVLTQPESREFVKFVGQKKGVNFRMYGGIYKSGTDRTKRYPPGTKLWSISVSRY